MRYNTCPTLCSYRVQITDGLNKMMGFSSSTLNNKSARMAAVQHGTKYMRDSPK